MKAITDSAMLQLMSEDYTYTKFISITLYSQVTKL